MTEMELTFLGTASSYPSPKRGVSCIALRHEAGIWLVDCGEGSQTQIMKSPLKPGRISKIFITHLHGDHCFGLPGLLCTVNSTTEHRSTEPIQVYGPVGLRHFLCTALALSRADLNFPFIVHELEILPEQILSEEAEGWEFTVPQEVPFHPREEQGTLIKPDHNQIWHVVNEEKLSVKAVWVKHRVPSFTYVIQEADRPGKLDAPKLKSMGVPPGPLYAQLKAGIPITTEAGQTIQPEQVLGPSSPGRTVIISGDSSDSSQLLKVGGSATVLVHEATLENGLREMCVARGHSTPEMAANLAKDLRVKMLILTHFSQRYKPASAELKGDEKSVASLEKEALQILPTDQVMIAEDLMSYKIPP